MLGAGAKQQNFVLSELPQFDDGCLHGCQCVGKVKAVHADLYLFERALTVLDFVEVGAEVVSESGEVPYKPGVGVNFCRSVSAVPVLGTSDVIHVFHGLIVLGFYFQGPFEVAQSHLNLLVIAIFLNRQKIGLAEEVKVYLTADVYHVIVAVFFGPLFCVLQVK